MIQEDYVSFEIAKLLKEKGFDEYGMYFYTLKDDGREGYKSNKRLGEFAHNSDPDLKDRAVSCPTQQMAMKWLREEHNIVIEINMEDYITEVDGKLTITYSYTIWHFNRHLNDVGETDIRYTDEAIWDKESHNSYEEAVKAALLYTLKNLI